MSREQEALSELIRLRVRVEYLEQDLSDALHILYCVIVQVAESADSEFKRGTLTTLKAKFHQMPQGFQVGQSLIELDKQFGCLLESNGVRLEQWVYEPREKGNG